MGSAEVSPGTIGAAEVNRGSENEGRVLRVTPPGECVNVDVDLLDELVKVCKVFRFLASASCVEFLNFFNLEEGFSHVVVRGVLNLCH